MIRKLWSKLVRLLSGEMDMIVLRNEVAQKWLDGQAILPQERALLETLGKTDAFLSWYLAIGMTVAQCGAMAKSVRVIAESFIKAFAGLATKMQTEKEVVQAG